MFIRILSRADGTPGRSIRQRVPGRLRRSCAHRATAGAGLSVSHPLNDIAPRPLHRAGVDESQIPAAWATRGSNSGDFFRQKHSCGSPCSGRSVREPLPIHLANGGCNRWSVLDRGGSYAVCTLIVWLHPTYTQIHTAANAGGALPDTGSNASTWTWARVHWPRRFNKTWTRWLPRSPF